MGAERFELPVPPVVRALGVLLIVNVEVGHQQVLPLEQVLVVISHVGAHSKAIKSRERAINI